MTTWKQGRLREAVESAVRRVWLLHHSRAVKHASNDEGATLVEMALSSVVLLMLLFGAIEFSFMMYTYHYISDAAREGARYAIVRGDLCTGFSMCQDPNGGPGATSTDITNYVKGLGYPGIDSVNNMSVVTKWYEPVSTTTPGGAATTTWSSTACDPTSSTCNIPGAAVAVTVNYTFPLSIPFWRITTFNITSTSQMVISQ